MVYADSFFEEFAGERDFLDFLEDRKGKTTWKKELSNTLRFEALVRDTPKTEAIVNSYDSMGKGDILKDTLDGTQLVLRDGDEYIPVRSCAIKTILERAKISGNALSKVERNVFAKILNHCMKVADGQALLKVSDDKVSAIHGGDKSDYSILEMYELFTKTSDYLNDNFSDVKYAGGFYDHSIVTALWTLDGNDELIKTYKDLLAMHSVKCRDLKASVRLTSSDVGISGANLYPTLIADGRNIPLGNPLIIEFTDGVRADYHERELDIIDLAYATTIHKSQGSEYSTVIIPIMMSHYIMLKRNLIYTAITRAKKKVILIGEKRALMAAIHKNDSTKRNTLLAERIKTYTNEMKKERNE